MGITIVRKLGEVEYDISRYGSRSSIGTSSIWNSAGPCFWIPLDAGHVLQSGQGALLGRLLD